MDEVGGGTEAVGVVDVAEDGGGEVGVVVVKGTEVEEVGLFDGGWSVIVGGVVRF